MPIDDRALAMMPFFSELALDERQLLGRVLVERAFDPGAVIFDIGEPGMWCGFVTHGDVDIQVDGGPGFEAGKVATLDVGELVGEMALIDGGRRSARCVAGRSGAALAVLDRSEFDLLLTSGNSFACALMDLVATQLARRLHHAADVLQRAALEA